MRVNKNVPQRERRRMVIDNFKGVDFSSPPLACSPTRSPDAVNFIGDHGINRKRHGWEKIVDVPYYNINGIYQVDEDTVLVYADKTFYEIKKDSSKKDSSNNRWDKRRLKVYSGWREKYPVNEYSVQGGDVLSDTTFLKDKRCYFYKYNDVVYVTGIGAMLKYCQIEVPGKEPTMEMRLVSPYIPVTTTNIGATDSADKITALEEPNLLTPIRKNKLVGNAKESTWILDHYIDESSFEDFETNYIPIYLFNVKIINGSEIINLCADKNGSLFSYEQRQTTDGTIILGIVNPNQGKVTWRNDDNRAQITLNIETTPTIKDASNIEVTFATSSGFLGYDNAKKSDQGKIAGTFEHVCFCGIGGSNDTMFVSARILGGIDETHNDIVCFSKEDNVEYFPDIYTAQIGTYDNSITGIQYISESTLAIYTKKGGKILRGEYQSEYDEKLKIKKTIPVYRMSDFISGCPISPYTFVNLHGDNLFFSKLGIYALEIEKNISENVIISRNRSRAIENNIKNKSTPDVVGIVYGNKCIFARSFLIKKGEETEDTIVYPVWFTDCFIADAAYRYVPDGELSYNYEWWYLENVPARVFAIVNDELWFGSTDGMICRFTDSYIDSYYSETDNGMVGTDGSVFALQTMDKDEIDFRRKYGGSLHNGRRVRIENHSTVNNGETDITNKDLYMCNVDKENKTFQLSYYNRGDDLLTTDDPDLVGPITFTFDDTYSSIRMRFYIDTPVKASWSTPPLDLGNDAVAKTMHSMTVTAESGTGAKFKFGYETRNGFMERNAEGTGKFDLNNIDFNDFSFENGFQNSFTVKTHARDFNYIRFHILSEEAAPCAVHRIGAEYKYTHKNRGVK